MSSKQPVVNAKALIKVVERKGFRFARQSGSHAIYINARNKSNHTYSWQKRHWQRLIKTNYERCRSN